MACRVRRRTGLSRTDTDRVTAGKGAPCARFWTTRDTPGTRCSAAGGSSRRFATLRGAYERARLLSMLSFFIGRRGMRDLGLPVALPWAIPPLVVANVVRYH